MPALETARTDEMALTDHGSEDYEPFRAVSIVLVQSRRVDAPSERAREESILYTDRVDDNGRENAAETHEGEDDTVAGIDLVEGGGSATSVYL